MTTTHPSLAAGASQCSIILNLLTNAAGEWVPLITLHVHCGSLAVHSRINDLRQRGHAIEQRSQRKGRMVQSFYRLPTADSTATLL